MSSIFVNRIEEIHLYRAVEWLCCFEWDGYLYVVFRSFIYQRGKKNINKESKGLYREKSRSFFFCISIPRKDWVNLSQFQALFFCTNETKSNFRKLNLSLVQDSFNLSPLMNTEFIIPSSSLLFSAPLFPVRRFNFAKVSFFFF